MKHILTTLFAVVAMIAPCSAATSPHSLYGSTAVLNYTQAQFCCMGSGWQSYRSALNNYKGCADILIAMNLPPKATRKLLPLNTPAQGGKYIYEKTGSNTGRISCELDGAFRNIDLTFTSSNTAIATELVFVGHLQANEIRNIYVTIQHGGGYAAPAPQPDSGAYDGGGDRSSLDPLIARMAALRCKHATSALYQKRLLTLLPMIRNGAHVDITLPETKGNTALHYSCAIGSLSITRWLLEHGANPNAVTNAGATPMMCVGHDNRAAIIQALKAYGGR